MHSSEPLLPPVSNLTDYILLFARGSVWVQAMQVICQRHGLPTGRLVRFGDGTDPADGSGVVFAVGDDLVIKLFPPFRKNLFDADLTVAEHVFGKLRVTTPEIYTHGMLDGWPYIVMSRVPGMYLSSIWDTLDDESQLRIVIELAAAGLFMMAGKSALLRAFLLAYGYAEAVFGIYSPYTGKVYLVPVREVPSGGDVNLRLIKTKNNQEKGIHWARDYEL